MDERYEDVAAFAAALSPYLGNAKKGKRVLADIVNGKMEELAAEEPERAWEPLPPLVDRLGLRGAAIAGRIVTAAAVALLAVIAGELAPGWKFGVNHSLGAIRVILCRAGGCHSLESAALQ